MTSAESTSGTAVPEAPTVRGRRNPKWIALGVVALCLGALGSFFLYSQVSSAQTVVAISNTVHRGAIVERGDLTTVTVGNTPGVRTVPGDQLDAIIGKRAAFDLVAGGLLAPDALTETLIPEPKRSVVGLRLVAGRAPSGQIPPGTRVRLVAIPPASADSEFTDSFSGKTIEAKMVSSQINADGVSVVVNVDVAAEQAAAVGTLGAQERLVLIWDAER